MANDVRKEISEMRALMGDLVVMVEKILQLLQKIFSPNSSTQAPDNELVTKKYFNSQGFI
jgi:hypothetical protein